MNSAYTVDLFDKEQTALALSSGFWQVGQEQSPQKAIDYSRMAKIAGLALSIVFSPFTVIPDPWLMERRRRDAVVTVSIYQEPVRRLISRAEVLRLTRQIIEQAERERLTIAELEAARGIQWGD